MALALTMDLQDGHSVRKTEEGWQFERIAAVTGMSGDGHSRIYNATLVSNFPEIGDSHPAVSTALLREISVIDNTPEEVKFRLTYSEKEYSSDPGFTDDSVESGASVIQVETQKDKNNDDITVSYGGNTYITSVSKLIPQYVLRIQKKRLFDPASQAITYVGKINSSTFKGMPARTCMCTAIVGYSDDGGQSFKVNYDFQYKEDTWIAEKAYRNPETGYIESGTYGTEEIYDEANFNGLGL